MASKITIKRSLTAAAPAGLSYGEMAFVQGSGNTAEQLYVGISGGNRVWVELGPNPIFPTIRKRGANDVIPFANRVS